MGKEKREGREEKREGKGKEERKVGEGEFASLALGGIDAPAYMYTITITITMRVFSAPLYTKPDREALQQS